MAGNKNSGRRAEKPFADALRMELAEAGADHKRLRAIARKLIEKAESGDLPAIIELANRTDGKPAQETALTIDDKRSPTDWTRDELVAFLNDAKGGGDGTVAPNGSSDKPDSVH